LFAEVIFWPLYQPLPQRFTATTSRSGRHLRQGEPAIGRRAARRDANILRRAITGRSKKNLCGTFAATASAGRHDLVAPDHPKLKIAAQGNRRPNRRSRARAFAARSFSPADGNPAAGMTQVQTLAFDEKINLPLTVAPTLPTVGRRGDRQPRRRRHGHLVPRFRPLRRISPNPHRRAARPGKSTGFIEGIPHSARGISCVDCIICSRL